ncbi:translation initiation factor 2 [Streptomyces sp. JNUCC 64]
MSPDDAKEPTPTCGNHDFRKPATDTLDDCDGRRATGDGRRATGDGRRATGDGRTVLFAARSAVALHRLFDVLPVFSGDDRITRLFTLVPGSDFGTDALRAIETRHGRTVPWSEACARSFDLIVAASPKGDLRSLRGPQVLLPHGAGFNKSIPGEGSADSASGLDPAFLRRDPDDAPIALHALAHPDQVARAGAMTPRAARRAKVVGDLTLERVLASAPLRDRYRAALGTGARRLLVLASTWGPDSLIRRHPGLPARLAARLPYDEYQLALVVHPNEWDLLGTHELTEQLAPALDAGTVLSAPYEEWAAVLIAADALVTDHGSAALYYCAAGDRPVVGVQGKSGELIPGSPMDVLLDRIPRWDPAGDDIAEALRAYRPGTGFAAAAAAFAHPGDRSGDAVNRLRTEVYALLGLAPPTHGAAPRPLPAPTSAVRVPTAFDVDVTPTATGVRITRRPAGTGPPGHHLAVEHGAAAERLCRSAGLLLRRPLPASPAPRPAPVDLAWTADGWTRHTLSAYPNCRTAAAVLPSGTGLLRVRGHEEAYAVRAEPRAEGGRVVRIDPAVALSAAHAFLLARETARHAPDTVPDARETVPNARGTAPGTQKPAPDTRTTPPLTPPPTTTLPLTLDCVIGDRTFRVTVRPAGETEATQVI